MPIFLAILKVHPALENILIFNTPRLLTCVLAFPHRADTEILKRDFCIAVDVRNKFHKTHMVYIVVHVFLNREGMSTIFFCILPNFLN